MFDVKLYFEMELALPRVGNTVCVCFDTTTVLANASVRSHLTRFEFLPRTLLIAGNSVTFADRGWKSETWSSQNVTAQSSAYQRQAIL
jgi:hypothetical protein